MEFDRRELLKKTGATATLGTAMAAATGTGAAQSDPADQWVPADSSNYSWANRGAGDIDWIVVHTTVGSYSGAISWFQNPNANVSAHYVIRNSDGHTTKMVDHSNVAWHASGFNSNSIGIEHEWTEDQGYISDTMYQQSAELIEYLADLYDVPLNYYTSRTAPCDVGGGIIEHRHAPTNSYCSQSNATSCPGPDWSGSQLMQYVGGGGGGGGKFEMDQAVHTTADLNAREGPGTGYPVVRTMPEGSPGRIVNGPETADGYTWWGLHFHGPDVWGWCAEPWLAACPTFCHGTRVETTADLNVRTGPSLGHQVGSTVAAGTRGVVTQGPQQGDGYQWWHVDWEDGSLGWSVVDYMTTA